MADETVRTVRVPEGVDLVAVLGREDENARMLEQAFDVRISVRDGELALRGAASDAEALSRVLVEAFRDAREGLRVDFPRLRQLVGIARDDALLPSALRDDVILTHKGKAIRPKTAGQKAYIDAIRTHDVTFGIGPAGSGKTYLAMAVGLAALRRREVKRIVLARPVVEAGESLGFLPGTLDEKVDPYIRPLYDALFDMMDRPRAQHLIEEGSVELAPLAYMRGRTLTESFVILDEAQNATAKQLKMFLTRMGSGTRMVITGDMTQTDLPRGTSGLMAAEGILGGIDGIAFCRLTGTDVVRHPLVAAIAEAFERSSI